MTTQSRRNLIYYPNGPGNIEQDMKDIAASPYYTNVVLGQFHLDKTSGELSWNQTPVSEVQPDEWDAVQLLSQGQYPKTVSMQLGSAGNGTWTYIANNMQQAADTVVAVVTGEYPIYGIDLDPEPIGKVALDTIFNFTLKLGGMKETTPFYLSHVPVPNDPNYWPDLYGPDYWPQMQPYVDWITPQWYGDVGPGLVSAYEQFITGLIPPPIVVAGQNASVTSLNDLVLAIEDLGKNYEYNWGGVGLWAYPLPDATWAQVIYNALQPMP